MKIKNITANKCLAIPAGSTDNNVQPITWDCSDYPDQEWAFNPKGQLVNMNSGKCLGIGGEKNDVVQWECGDTTNFLWDKLADGTIKSRGYQTCLNIYGGSTENGAIVGNYTCGSEWNSQWSTADPAAVVPNSGAVCGPLTESTSCTPPVSTTPLPTTPPVSTTPLLTTPPGSTTPPPNKNCVATWKNVVDSPCTDGKQKQVYTITTEGSGTGTKCTAVDGATKDIDCAVEWYKNPLIIGAIVLLVLMLIGGGVILMSSSSNKINVNINK